MHKAEIRGLLCSMLLGDSYIRISETKGHTGGSFWTEHSQHQYDYLMWKKQQIDNIFKAKGISRECRVYNKDRYDKRTGKIYKSCSSCLSWKSYFTFLRKKAYRHDRTKNVEWLLKNINSDKHVSIWFMDDGSESRTKSKHITGEVYFRNPYFRLAGYCFTTGQCQLIKQWFEQKYEVSPSINMYKHGPIIQFSVKDTKKLFPHFRPYVSQIESMRNKFRLCLERY